MKGNHRCVQSALNQSVSPAVLTSLYPTIQINQCLYPRDTSREAAKLLLTGQLRRQSVFLDVDLTAMASKLSYLLLFLLFSSLFLITAWVVI